MRKRKFEEDVVEETTTETTEIVEETSPDLHDQFVSILVDMGLSAEQAEAVHSTAMDLLNAGEGEVETTETVTEETKVEARRARRGYSRRNRMMGAERREVRNRRFSEAERVEMMTERRLRRLQRENRELRQQLREFGASPASRPVRNRPSQGQQFAQPNMNGLAKSTARAIEIMNKYKK